MIFVFIPILGEYLAPQLVGGARGVMIGNLIVNFFSGAQYTRGAAAALLVAALIVVLLDDLPALARGGGRLPCVSSRSSRRARGSCASCSAAWAVLVYVFLFAPIVLLVLFSFNANRYGTFPFTGWTTHWYGQVFGDYQIKDALTTTLEGRRRGDDHRDDRRHGGGVPARALAAAVPERRARSAFTLPIMIPGLLIGVSLLVLLTSAVPPAALPADGGDRPVRSTRRRSSLLLVAARLQGFDPSLERAASATSARTRSTGCATSSCH